jgi:hypothetical protein
MKLLEQELTHTLPVTTANETRLGEGFALYYNPTETLGPDYATIGLGRVASKIVDTAKNNRIYEAGVGTGAFFVSAALSSDRARHEGLHVIGNDISLYALQTTQYNLDELVRRKGLDITADLQWVDWSTVLADTSLPGANCAVAHFNPPFKMRGDYVGVGEGTTAPDQALYATPNPTGYPSEYENYLPGIYSQLADDGVAMVRLPSGQHEIDFNIVGFNQYIDGVQARAFGKLGLRYCKVLIDIPEKTPIPWDNQRQKQIPYRSAAGLLVSRELPECLAADMAPNPQNPQETIIYQDVQIRVRALGSAAAAALIN